MVIRDFDSLEKIPAAFQWMLILLQKLCLAAESRKKPPLTSEAAVSHHRRGLPGRLTVERPEVTHFHLP